jgi:hypothetical protein
MTYMNSFLPLLFSNLRWKYYPHLKFNDWAHVTATPFRKNLVSDLMWLLLVFMMPYLHNLYIIINRRRWGIIFRQYLWNILMFILLYSTTGIFKISCIIFYNIDLHHCEQIFTHLHLNFSGKAFAHK